MFFFIGGIQPRTVELDKKSMPCPSCGLYQAKIKRTDHYLSVFFLPVLRIKKGEPFIICERCGAVFSDALNGTSRADNDYSGSRCPHCGRQIEPGFRFCPSCGGRL